MAYYCIDRFEGRMAVVIGDDGATYDVPKRRLPKGVREGSVLRVDLGSDGVPEWKGARVDREEEGRRIREESDRIEKLREADPGRDLIL